MGSRSPLPVSTSTVVSPVLIQRAPRRGLFSPAIKPSEPENTLLKMVLAKLPHPPADWLTFSLASQCEKSMLWFDLCHLDRFLTFWTQSLDDIHWFLCSGYKIFYTRYTRILYVIKYSIIIWNQTIKRQVCLPNFLSQSDQEAFVEPWLLLLYII